MAVWQPIKSQNLSYGLRLDPEFYRPEYTKSRRELESIGTKTITELKEDIRYGLQAEPDYLQNGTNYIRALNLRDVGIEGEILKIAESQIPSQDYLAKAGDILITRSGANCGDTGVIENGFIGATYGSYIIRIRLQKINPFFAYAFLQTKYGRFQTMQIRTGLAQPNLSIPYIENLIEIPHRISSELQKMVESIIKSAFEKQRFITKLYQEAEQELLERMEWEKVKISHVLDYRPTSIDIMNDQRLDPEFYQPKFANLEKHLKKIGAMPLGDFCPTPNRGVQPQYEEGGEVLVINSKHLGPTEIDIDNAEKTTKEFFNDEINRKAKIEKLDVLMYSTGAYVGRTNAYFGDKEALASNHVSIIRPDKNVCDPAYLALFLNSSAGLMQTDQRASGSAQREIYPQEIVKYLVFIPKDKNGKLDMAWQKKLAEKVIAANYAKKSAKQKLQEAKQLVEAEIEKLL